MKKIIFSAYSMDVGGIEAALLTLLNELSKKGYEITLVLERKQGIFLQELNKSIKIIEYSPSNSKNIIKRKVVNLFKRIKFTIKYKNNYDFSASYATYSLPGSFIARIASKNNAIWVHSNYMQMFDNNKDKYIDFFNNVNIDKYKNIVFVSNESKDIFVKFFDKLENRCNVINNIIDYKKILKLSEEKIELNKENIKTFLFVGRLTEEDKKITRLIESAKILNDENQKFRVLIIGDGKNRNMYIDLVKKYKLEDKIFFLGQKKNPYPYFKISDSLILTSEYEGFPVVYNEAKILRLPIITTNVSDSQQIIGEKFGIITNKNTNSIVDAMKKIINNEFKIKEKFDCEKYNNKNINKILNLLV